jgi:uncharacterized protein (TIGR02231 family)
MAALILGAATAKAEENPKINSKVEKVTVFLNGAQVNRSATVSIKPGNTTLVFGNISKFMQPQSIQVQATGDFTILSVTPETNVTSEQTKQKAIDDLELQQKNVQDKIAIQNDMMFVYQEEEKLLLKNQLISGPNNNVDISRLKLALDFQTARLTELKKSELSVTNQLLTLNLESAKLNNLITETRNSGEISSSNILVTVSSLVSTQGQFTLSYLVPNAHWTPLYDLRAKDAKSPVTIVYKANVTQQSGEDWKNVKLTLSTGNPYVNANKPVLSPYLLDVQRPLNIVSRDKSLNEVVLIRGLSTLKEQDQAIQGKLSGLDVSQQENQVTTEFNINTPFSVAADGKQYTVEMNQVSLPAKYKYYVAPKINTSVFLTAQVTDWNKYNFLPGDMNLFYEGTYIGKSYLHSGLANDTLNLSLGIDKNIVVTRTLQQNLTGKQGLASNTKQLRDWLIEVKNRKSQVVDLSVEDQIPVSENTDIVVEVKELSGGQLDAKTGLVTWDFTLNPLDNKKTTLSYQVRYPKNQTVIVQ